MPILVTLVAASSWVRSWRASRVRRWMLAIASCGSCRSCWLSRRSRAFLATSLSCSAAAGEPVMSAGGVRRASLSSPAMSGNCWRKVVLSRSGAANQKYSWHQGPQLSLLLPIT